MIVYGYHPVLNIVKYKPELVKELYLSRELAIDQLKKFKIKFLKKDEMEHLTRSREHQGIACSISHYPYADFDNIYDRVNNIIILDHIEDPRNLGAILRNALAFSIDLVIIPKDRSCDITPAVIKTSAGAAILLNIAKVININNCIRSLKDNFFKIYGLEADGDRELSEIKFDKKKVLVLGSEGKGLSHLTKKLCDHVIRIDFNHKASSLNVSSASAIALYKLYMDDLHKK